jgi:MOSC domain-containing protein YiiM
MSGRVVSVNVGRPAALWTGSRIVDSAIGKQPVSGPVAARGINLEGDDQADRQNHGGVEQAVYAYASEDTAWWGELTGKELGPAAFGENLTVAGVDVSRARIGERWRIGSVELRVAGPRVPCYKLEATMRITGFQKAFLHAGRPGAYLAIAQEGVLQAGDAVEVARPDHDVTVSLVIQALLIDRDRLPELEPARPYMLPKLAAWYEELQEKAA